MRRILDALHRTSNSTWLATVFLLNWITYLSYFWINAISTDDQGTMLVHQVNIWGDWAAHSTMVSHFLFQGLSDLNGIFLIDTPLSYPFLHNWLNAALSKLSGLHILSSMLLSSWLLSLICVGATIWWYRQRLNSLVTGIVASTLFLMNGGMGWWYWLKDNSPWPVVSDQYTKIPEVPIEWINVVNSMVIPQRAFVLGFPLALLGMGGILWLREQHGIEKFSARKQWFIAILSCSVLGLLPLLHTHSFLAAFVILACVTLADLVSSDSRREILSRTGWWSGIAMGVGVVALPIWFLFFGDHISRSFIQWKPGWYASEDEINWLVFWLLNWGIVPITSLVGSIWMGLRAWKRKDGIETGLLLSGWVIFALLNLFQFQPFIWDNTKLLVWSSLIFSGVTAWLLVRLKTLAWWGLSLSVLIFLSATASSVLDLSWTLQFEDHSYGWYSQSQLSAAEWVIEHTDPDSVWVTHTEHNNWLYTLTGRQTLLTYEGWLWTHGYDYMPIKQDYQTMLRNPDGERARELYAEYGVDYIVVENSIDIFDSKKPSSARAVYETQNIRILKM